jgi:hypothetical protein
MAPGCTREQTDVRRYELMGKKDPSFAYTDVVFASFPNEQDKSIPDRWEPVRVKGLQPDASRICILIDSQTDSLMGVLFTR